MCSQDSLGLIGYNFEPEYSSEELAVLDNLPSDRDVTGLDLEHWCECTNCFMMPTQAENVCCRGSELTLANLDDYSCITDHANFEDIVLNPVILEVAYIQIMVFKGQRGRAPDELNNKQSRLTAYRQFVCWMLRGEKLGKGNRVVIPACVVKAVRERFPEPSDDYIGFKTVLDSARELYL